MTNQYAIDYLTALWNSDHLSVDEGVALGMAIKALEQTSALDKAVEHYEGTLETLKGIDLEDNEDIPMEYFESGGV